MTLSRLAPVAILSLALLASACANTVRGVGKDVKQTGQAVEDTLDG
ncbi:MAG: entericidin A/B family lipoprotein [Rhizobiaceae bacterium]|nr:entericidin A/B family lipoprotein [Rhizobiaceae bacterium]